MSDVDGEKVRTAVRDHYGKVADLKEPGCAPGCCGAGPQSSLRLGYSEELIRLWDYYLCYCEAAFEERHVGVVQIQFDNFQCRRDPIQIGNRAALVPDSPCEVNSSMDSQNIGLCLT